MTNQEKYEVVEEVCNRIRASLQKESERLKEQAEIWKAKDEIGWTKTCMDKACNYVEAQINVTSVEMAMKWELLWNSAKKE